MMPRKVSCRVDEIISHGGHVYTLYLTPHQSVPPYKPGQFLHLALDPYDPSGFWPDSRPFSIANSITANQRIAICYSAIGEFTRRMERELVVGKDVWVKLPYGDFFIDPTRDSVLFAGGTGMAAFTAYIDSLSPTNDKKVIVCYGTRERQLQIFRPLLEKATGCCPGLSVRYFLERFDALQTGEYGGYLSVDSVREEASSLDNPNYYLSGPPQMLASLSDRLKSSAVPDERIKIDAW